MKTIIFCSDFTPLPFKNSHLHIDGRLAQAIIDDNPDANIVWLRTDFSHYEKSHGASEAISACDRLTIVTFKGVGYSSNVNLKRFLHNIKFGFNCFVFLLKNRQFELVVSPIPAIETSFFSSVACLLLKRKHVILVYDLWPDIFLKYYKKGLLYPCVHIVYAIYNFLLKFSLKRAFYVFAVSREYLDWALRKSAITKYDTLYIGVDEHLNDNFVSKENNEILVVYVGSWGVSYDIDLIFSVAKNISDKRFRFVIAGCTDPKRLNTKTENLTVLGWLNDAAKHELLLKADIGVMAYKSGALQSLPNKIFEYLSYGCYVINTLKGESEELLNQMNSGATIQSGDISQFIDELRKFTQLDYDRQKTAQNTYQKFGKRYFKESAFKLMTKTIED